MLTLEGPAAYLRRPQRGGACKRSAVLIGTRGRKAEISRISTKKSGSPAEGREMHGNALAASADLSTAGDVNGLSSKYLPLHLEGAKTRKFTHLTTVTK